MASDAARADRSRRSIRLKDYDYSQAGAYFITICTQDRVCMFGDVVDSEMRLNDAGRMVVSEWQSQPTRFPVVRLDAFVVMPNHIHGVLWIENDAGATTTVAPTDSPPNGTDVGAGLVPALDPAPARNIIAGASPGATTRVAPTVGRIVGAFKSSTTVAYARGVEQSGWPVFRGRLWQRNYYEHIVRDRESLNRIRQYIADNPAQWSMDRENPNNVGAGLVPAPGLVPARIGTAADSGATTRNGATTRVAPTGVPKLGGNR